MSDWWSGDVVAHGIRIHYTRTGRDRPPLVLAHGMADSGLCWSRLAKALEADYDIIMPDARSHGRSGRSNGDYTTDDLAADLTALIEALGLERPLVGGHSMGGLTTVAMAASRPDLLSAAILEDPPLWPVRAPLTPEEAEARLDERRQAFERERSGGREALLVRGRSDNPLWADEEFEPWVDSKLAVDTVSVPRLSETLNWRDPLAHMQCPALLVTGDPELGAIVTPEVAQEAVQLQPLVTVVRIAGAGHSIRREQFEHFVEAVRDFLARVEATTSA